MPTYAYACKDCSHEFDVVQSFTDDSLTVCPTCDGALRKKFNSVGVVFKGSGFYRNDSRSQGSGSNGSSSPSAGSEGTKKESSGSADSSSSAPSSSSSSADKGSESSSGSSRSSGSGGSSGSKTPVGASA